MAKSERQVDIAIVAHDEASSVFKSTAAAARQMAAEYQQANGEIGGSFKSIGQFAREANLEARASGDMAIEKILKGGGALGLLSFAMESVQHGAHEAAEAMRGVGEGGKTLDDGIHGAAAGMLDAIPIVGKMARTLSEIGEAGAEVAGGLLRAGGASEETATMFVSAAERMKKEIADFRAVGVVSEAAIRAEERGNLAALQGVAKEKEAAKQAYEERLEQIDKLRAEQSKGKDQKTKDKITAEAGKANEAEESAYLNRLAEIDHNALQERQADAKAHADRMRDLQSRERQENLRGAGDEVDAQLEAIKNRTATEIDGLRKRVADEKKKRPQSDYGDIEKAASEEEAAIVAEGEAAKNREMAKGEKEFHDHLVESNKKHADENERKLENEQAFAEYMARSQEQLLRDGGHVLDAELLQLKTGHDREIAEIARAVREKRATEQQGNAERAAADQAYADAQAATRTKAANNADDKAGSVTTKLAQERIEILKQEAAGGNAVAAEELRKLEIAERYREKREEILKMLRDEKGLTGQQQADAKQILADLDVEKDKSINRKLPDRQDNRQASLEESSQLQGVGSNPQAQEALQAQKDLLAENQKQTDLQQKTSDAMAELLRIAQQPAGPVESFFGGPVDY